MKTAQDFLAEASAVVERLSPQDAIAAHGKPDSVFVDVRDSSAIARTGTVAGAHHVPRGMLEFTADPATGAYNPALTKDASIYVICAAGGQAALAGKTLKDMGYSNVWNIGGISDWKAAGGPVEGP